MKKLITVLLLSFLFVFPACSEDDSPSETKSQSDIKGDWGVNYESYSGMSLIEKLAVYLTVNETSGALSGSGTVSYTNNGTNTTQLDIENSVAGFYQANQSPNIVVTVGAQAGSTPPFTFTGDWDEFGVNFKGNVTIYSGNQIYTLTDQSFYKRGN